MAEQMELPLEEETFIENEEEIVREECHELAAALVNIFLDNSISGDGVVHTMNESGEEPFFGLIQSLNPMYQATVFHLFLDKLQERGLDYDKEQFQDARKALH